MQELTPYLIGSLAALASIAVLSLVALRGWRDWIDYKKAELTTHVAAVSGERDTGPSPIARIEVADLKERVRKLEAIAAGVEL